MEYFKLGETGIKASKYCLGTMNFGMVTSSQEAFKILDKSVEVGINFIDTSNSYGGYTNRGASERIIGEWLKNNPAKRNKIILATKVYSCTENIFDNPNDEKGLSGYKIRHHLDASLKRLNTDHIELYQMHHIDRTCNFDSLWDAFYREFMLGKIDYVGSSNFSAFDLLLCQNSAQNKHFIGLVSEQHRYNLMHRLAELEVLPATKRLGISFLAWGPLDAGRLSDHVYRSDELARCSHNTITDQEKIKIDEYKKLCQTLGVKEQVLAMAWLLHEPIDGIVIGPRTEQQLDDYLIALEYPLTEEIAAEINKIFPPVGSAPEAYSW